MTLSDEQMAAARHGLPSAKTWEPVALPVGPQPLPAWVRGLHIDWMEGYGNPPHYRLRVTRDVRGWPGQTFVKEGRRYMAQTPDGRAEVFYHDGPVRLETLTRWDAESQSRVEFRAMATTQQDGFGGAHIPVFLAASDDPALVYKIVYLRGPWHGGAPPGFVACAYHDNSDPHHASAFPRRNRWWRPWWQRVGRGGLFITEDLWLRIVARYWPHVTVARVTDALHGRDGLQAVRPDWDAPKDWILERGRR